MQKLSIVMYVMFLSATAIDTIGSVFYLSFVDDHIYKECMLYIYI